MAPKNKSPSGKTMKKKKAVMDIAQKMKILQLLDEGEKVSAVARRFVVNESTIRTIRDNKQKIRESASKLGPHAKFCKISRSDKIEKMEDMLIMWMQDLIHKHVPLSGLAIRQQALAFYNFLKEKSPSSSNETFVASRGWFEKFKKRFSLHNVSFSGEKASADLEAAARFPGEFQKFVAEKGYSYDQVFNCDETGLYWKKMPSRTYLTQKELSAPGFKVSKDRFTLLFCANASGTFRCKPMLVYKSETPRVLKNKQKQHLPVFWKSNKSSWVTKAIFRDWFLRSFIPEVKEFLAKKNLSFRVLLTLDNVGSHDESLQTLDPNVEVMFLPPNTTSLLQPMDQSVIATFKATYLRHVMKEMLKTVNHDRQNLEPSFKVKTFWKNFNILDSIGFVEESWAEMKSSTLNNSWSKLLPQAVTKFLEEPTYEEFVQSLLKIAREIGGEGFDDMNESDLKEITQPSTALSAEEIEEILNDAQEEDESDEEPDEKEGILKLATISKIVNFVRDAIEEAISEDPIMSRSLRFRHDAEIALRPYEELYKDMKRRAKQKTLNDFFKTT